MDPTLDESYTLQGFKFIQKLARKIAECIAKDPTTLGDRTPEEIREVLETERDSAIKKLALMDAGQAWNKGKEKGGAVWP